MNRRQLLALFLCSLTPWWVGSALMPLLPIYAADLGASPAMVGNYLSFIFLTLAMGTVFAGWISARVPRLRTLMVGSGLVGVVSTYLMGQATAIGHLLLFNAASWFAGGMELTLVAILAGRSAGRHERGKIFGMLAMTTALGGVLGGPAGIVVDRWGYPPLFTATALLWVVPILAAGFLPQRQENQARERPQPESAYQPRLGYAFLLLMVAVLFFGIGSFVASLGRSLTMDTQGFTATAISSIAALGSGVGMVLNPMLGRLSDRINRRLLLALVYAAGALSLVTMATATTLAAFAMASVLVALSGAERGISSALVVDLLPSHALNRGLSLFDAVKWLGGVIGFAVTGYAVQLFGLQSALLLNVLLPVMAILLLAVGHQFQMGGRLSVPAGLGRE